MALLRVALLMHLAREGHLDERDNRHWCGVRDFLSLRYLQTVLGLEVCP